MQRSESKREMTHMCEDLLREAAPFRLVKRLVKAQEPSAALEAVSSHLQLVHRVHVLHMHLDTRAVRGLRRPEVQVFVSPRLEVERVVAVVEVGQFGKKIEMLLRVQFRV